MQSIMVINIPQLKNVTGQKSADCILVPAGLSILDSAVWPQWTPHMDGEENTAPPLHHSLTDSFTLCLSWGKRAWHSRPFLDKLAPLVGIQHYPAHSLRHEPTTGHIMWLCARHCKTFRVLSSMETRQNPGAATLTSTVHVVKSLKSAWEKGREEKPLTPPVERLPASAEEVDRVAFSKWGGRDQRMIRGLIRRLICAAAQLWQDELHRCAPLFRLSLLFFQGFGLRSALSQDYQN